MKGLKNTLSLTFEGKHLRQLFFLTLSALVVSLLEIVGVASVAPFISMVFDRDLIQENASLLWIYQTLEFKNNDEFIVFFGILVIIFLLLANTYQSLHHYFTTYFSKLFGHDFSMKLLKKYLSKDYQFFLDRNSSEFSKNIIIEVDRVVKGVIMAGIITISRAILVLCMSIFLISLNPLMGFFLLFGIGGSYALIYLFFRKSLATTGRKSSIYTADRLKVTSEAFGAIKELKLYNNSDIFLGRFEHPSLNTAKYTAKSLLISLIPKYLMETIAFASLIGSVLYMITIGYEQSFILASLTLYAFAGYRLIPGFQMLYQQITLIKFNYPALVFLLADLETEPKKQTLALPEEIKFEDKIVLEGISFTFPKTKKKILDRMNIEIQKNSSIGLVGSTGSGKTTFVDLLLGLIKQDEGKITVDGVELNDSNIASWQKKIGYVPQEIFLYDDSIKKNIAFGIPDESVDSSKLEKAINNSQLDQFIESLPNGSNTIVGERGVKLSGGQRQRIGIARALYNDPEILFMDEATSSLDGKTEDIIMESINHLSSQLTLFLVAHRVTTLRECDQIYFLENGKIIESGSYTYLLENSKSFKDLSNLGI
tara:strand:+ start:1344 stop:3131 length:1788 start_codon:yes stop_codon:yes gene_type:complete